MGVERVFYRVKNLQESQREYKGVLETIASADREAKQATEILKKTKLPFWIKDRTENNLGCG